MNEYEPTEEQKNEWIIQALTMSGFEEVSDDLYACSAGDRRVGVDLSAGVSIYFVEGTQRIDDDDEVGTLKKVADIISDAMCGTMPTKTEPDMHYSVNVPVPAAHQEIVGIVRPAVTAQQAIMAWNEFQALKKAVLTPTDFQKIGGHDYMKKSAWRKFATFFNLTDKIVEETQTMHQEGGGWTWKIKVECSAPNGRITEGVGMCSTSERNFAHVEHDTYATAHTRAKNRAISDMIAAGEVSAEEVGP